MTDDAPLTDEELAMIKMAAGTCLYCKPSILSLVAEVERLRGIIASEDLRAEMDRLQEATGRVVAAIRDEGPVPAYHRATVRLVRQEWPVLWRALDQLVDLRLSISTCPRAHHLAPVVPLNETGDPQ